MKNIALTVLVGMLFSFGTWAKDCHWSDMADQELQMRFSQWKATASLFCSDFPKSTYCGVDEEQQEDYRSGQYAKAYSDSVDILFQRTQAIIDLFFKDFKSGQVDLRKSELYEKRLLAMNCQSQTSKGIEANILFRLVGDLQKAWQQAFTPNWEQWLYDRYIQGTKGVVIGYALGLGATVKLASGRHMHLAVKRILPMSLFSLSPLIGGQTAKSLVDETNNYLPVPLSPAHVIEFNSPEYAAVNQKDIEAQLENQRVAGENNLYATIGFFSAALASDAVANMKKGRELSRFRWVSRAVRFTPFSLVVGMGVSLAVDYGLSQWSLIELKENFNESAQRAVEENDLVTKRDILLNLNRWDAFHLQGIREQYEELWSEFRRLRTHAKKKTFRKWYSEASVRSFKDEHNSLYFSLTSYTCTSVGGFQQALLDMPVEMYKHLLKGKIDDYDLSLKGFSDELSTFRRENGSTWSSYAQKIVRQRLGLLRDIRSSLQSLVGELESGDWQEDVLTGLVELFEEKGISIDGDRNIGSPLNLNGYEREDLLRWMQC